MRAAARTLGPRIALALAGVLALGGCRFSAPEGTADGGIDGIDGAPPDMASSGFCVGTFLRVCTPDPPRAQLDLGTVDINTGTSPDCLVVTQGNPGRELCVLYAGAITVSGTVKVEGVRPLVLAATTTLAVTAAGRVDASSVRAMRTGPGANDPACNSPVSPAGRAGGAGGSLGGSGGSGGAATGGTSGTPGGAITTFTRVMGGCRGGGSGLGMGGLGGGGVMLIAGTRIVVDAGGLVVASGAGGLGGADGGDGGGSGGFIGFDAPTVQIAGRVTANGGGGGGGEGSSGSGQPGSNGGDDALAALGGPGGTGAGGGKGGDGAAGLVLAGGNGASGSNGGGGGGGGGAGAIVVFGRAPEVGGTFSPPVRVQP